MLKGIELLCHSSIKISKDKIIYFDPYQIKEDYHDADIIFITHSHYDHFSLSDIKKVIKEDTMFVVPNGLVTDLLNFGITPKYIIGVVPNQSYHVLSLDFKTGPAFNVEKPFHPRENGWVGYILNIADVNYYIAGDTDMTIENQNVKCDVAFVPIGGTYTMDYKEASKLINTIKPKIAVPTHYGLIVGTKKDAINFSNSLDDDITCEILIKDN